MIKRTIALVVFLIAGGELIAQTAAPSGPPTGGITASSVIFTQPSAVDTFLAANSSATYVKADSSGVTFKKANGAYSLVSGKGVTYQQNGQWMPTKVQIAAVSDGSGWLLGGVGFNAKLVKTNGSDKDISFTSGSVVFNLHAPQLAYNPDGTFTFKEASTNWLVHVSGAGISIETTVSKRTGADTHSFGFEAIAASAVGPDDNGDLNVAGAVHVTRPIVIGADRKVYAVCSPWTVKGSKISFSCDDTTLPDTALPYVIDPVLSTGSEDSGTLLHQTFENDCCWDGLNWAYPTESAINFDISSIPADSAVTSVSVDTSGVISTWYPQNYGGTPQCTQYPGNWRAWPNGAPGDMQAIPGSTDLVWSFKFGLGWYADGLTYVCQGFLIGLENATATINYGPALPTITGVSPSSGLVGSNVTITGTHFGATQTGVVWIGDRSATIVSWSSTSIVAQIPSATCGQCSVVVALQDNWSNGANFTITGPPWLYGAFPNRAAVGTPITLIGSRFGATRGSSTVSFNGINSTPTAWSDTSITVPVPAGLTTGNVVVTVGGLSSSGYEFIGSLNYTIASSPSGLSMSVDGTNCTSPCSVWWLPGDTHTIAATTPQDASPKHYVFSSWSDGGAATHTVTAPNASTTYTANFLTQYYLTTSSTNGTISPSGYQNTGQVQVTATPSPGYSFTGFGGALSGMTNPQTLNLTGPATVTATFAVLPTTTISTLPAAWLTVNIDGTDFTCPCAVQWIPGTYHSVSAGVTPGDTGTQYVFASWSDHGAASHSVLAGSSGASLTANFTPQYYFTGASSPSGAGGVSPGSGWYNAGSSFWVTATASTGYRFTSFSNGYTYSFDVVMNGPVNVTANFIPVQGQTITSTLLGMSMTVDGASCTSPCYFEWADGTQHTIAAPSSQTFGTGTLLNFANWSDGGAISHTVTASPRAVYTANFSTQYYLTTVANPPAGGSISPSSGWYNSGQSVQVTATANSGYPFAGFTDGLTGTLNPQSLTMNGPVTVTANFTSLPLTHAVTSTPSSQSFTVDNVACTNGTCMFSSEPGHTLSVPQSAVSATGRGSAYHFWTTDGSMTAQVASVPPPGVPGGNGCPWTCSNGSCSIPAPVGPPQPAPVISSVTDAAGHSPAIIEAGVTTRVYVAGSNFQGVAGFASFCVSGGSPCDFSKLISSSQTIVSWTNNLIAIDVWLDPRTDPGAWLMYLNVPFWIASSAWANPSMGNVEVEPPPSVDSLQVTQPATPNAVDGTAPGVTPVTVTNTSSAFGTGASIPLTLLLNSGTVTVVAVGIQPANAAAQVSWKIDEDPSDTYGGQQVPQPSSTSGASTTFAPSVPGNFRLIAYFDANADGTFTEGEQLRVLQFAIVRATLQPSASNFTTNNLIAPVSPPTGKTRLRAGGDFITNAAMTNVGVYLLEGGGNNRTIGTAQITIGDVGNLVGDTFVVDYPVPTPPPAPPGNVNGAGAESPGGPTPMADYTASAGPPPFRGSNTPAQNLPAPPATGGLIYGRICGDDPFFSWFSSHPATNNPWGTTDGGNGFLEYWVAQSSSFPQTYVAIGQVAGWSVIISGSNISGAWTCSNCAVSAIAGPFQGPVQVLGKSYATSNSMQYTPDH